ncbi:YIP1 family protein [Deinococcus sp. 6GRE01]|nr:YIP1 family protein [Deinococcus sp. 6GRE01]
MLTSLTPWRLIFTHPRQAMRRVLPTPPIIARVATLLTLFILVGALEAVAEDGADAWVGGALGGMIGSFIGVYLGGLMSGVIARLLGGHAAWHEQRLAVAWGVVPSYALGIVVAIISLATHALSGNSVPEALQTTFIIIGMLWSLGTTSLTLAETNAFSVGKGLVAALAPCLLIGLALLWTAVSTL